MQYNVETNARICLLKRLDETHFGGFGPHQLLPETATLLLEPSLLNIDISLNNNLYFTSIYPVPAVTSQLQLINQEACYTS